MASENGFKFCKWFPQTASVLVMDEKKKIEEIGAWVRNEVKESIEFAENSPYPEGKELYEDGYKEKDYPFIKEY